MTKCVCVCVCVCVMFIGVCVYLYACMLVVLIIICVCVCLVVYKWLVNGFFDVFLYVCTKLSSQNFIFLKEILSICHNNISACSMTTKNWESVWQEIIRQFASLNNENVRYRKYSQIGIFFQRFPTLCTNVLYLINIT